MSLQTEQQSHYLTHCEVTKHCEAFHLKTQCLFIFFSLQNKRLSIGTQYAAIMNEVLTLETNLRLCGTNRQNNKFSGVCHLRLQRSTTGLQMYYSEVHANEIIVFMKIKITKYDVKLFSMFVLLKSLRENLKRKIEKASKSTFILISHQ